jgi:hypothetical protein
MSQELPVTVHIGIHSGEGNKMSDTKRIVAVDFGNLISILYAIPKYKQKYLFLNVNYFHNIKNKGPP